MLDKVKRILYPTDFSDYSQAAKEYALYFARQNGTQLYVLNVVEPMYDMAELYTPNFSMVDLYQEIEGNAKGEMEKLFSEDEKEELHPETMLNQGSPFAEIVSVANEKDIDLIVISTHGRTGLDHVFFGSVAEKVVRKAPCSVYVVKNKGKNFVMPY